MAWPWLSAVPLIVPEYPRLLEVVLAVKRVQFKRLSGAGCKPVHAAPGFQGVMRSWYPGFDSFGPKIGFYKNVTFL